MSFWVSLFEGGGCMLMDSCAICPYFESSHCEYCQNNGSFLPDFLVPAGIEPADQFDSDSFESELN